MTEKPRTIAQIATAWAVLLALVLPPLYLPSAGLVAWCQGRGILSQMMADPLLSPAAWYVESGGPGSDVIANYLLWCLEKGAGL